MTVVESVAKRSRVVIAALVVGFLLGVVLNRHTEATSATYEPPIDPAGTRYLDRVFTELDEVRDVRFANPDGAGPEGLHMDVFFPADDGDRRRPIFIAAFGGGFRIGNRSDVEYLARDFAHRGYVAATIDYRLTDHHPWTERDVRVASVNAANDGLTALRFLREDPEAWGVRTDAAVMGGVSAGGILSAMNGTADADELSTVQGVLNLAGAMFTLDGIDADDAVMYAVHHEFDPIVPCGTSMDDPWGTGLEIHGSCALIERYDEIGIPSGFTLIEGSTGHGVFSDEQSFEMTDAAARLFFDEVVN